MRRCPKLPTVRWLKYLVAQPGLVNVVQASFKIRLRQSFSRESRDSNTTAVCVLVMLDTICEW